MDIFDMIGSGGSHAAGAVRIGKISRKIPGEKPVKTDIGLAATPAGVAIKERVFGKVQE